MCCSKKRKRKRKRKREEGLFLLTQNSSKKKKKKKKKGLIGSTFELVSGASKLLLAVFVDTHSPSHILSFGLLISTFTNLSVFALSLFLLPGSPLQLALFVCSWGVNGMAQAVGWPALARIFLAWFFFFFILVLLLYFFSYLLIFSLSFLLFFFSSFLLFFFSSFLLFFFSSFLLFFFSSFLLFFFSSFLLFFFSSFLLFFFSSFLLFSLPGFPTLLKEGSGILSSLPIKTSEEPLFPFWLSLRWLGEAGERH